MYCTSSLSSTCWIITILEGQTGKQTLTTITTTFGTTITTPGRNVAPSGSEWLSSCLRNPGNLASLVTSLTGGRRATGGQPLNIRKPVNPTIAVRYHHSRDIPTL